MDTKDEPNLNDPKLLRAGEAVARLSHPEAPQGLAARTMARISSSYKPVKRVFWLLRPITHPLARIAAAALIIYMLFPMTDVDLGARLGMQIEQNFMGHVVGDRVEALVDGVLTNHNYTTDSQAYLDSFMGVNNEKPGNGTVKVPLKHLPNLHVRKGSGT